MTEPGPYFNPLWSRDGQFILFGAGLSGDPGELRRRAWDGTGSEEVLFRAEGLVRPGDVSPDGRVVAYTSFGPKGDRDILVLPLAGEKKASGLIQTPGSESQPQFSPDGRWLAYTAFEGAGLETYIEPNPLAGGRWQVSISGGSQPRWRPDGREIFYLALDGTLMVVDIDPAPSGLKVGQAKALFRAPVNPAEFYAPGQSHCVVAANGQRFLFASPLTGGAPPPVTVVLNWAAERQP